jgi:inhibitor of KinA
MDALRWEPLGDQAVLAYSPDEQAALAFATAVRSAKLPWCLDVVQAYTSVAVFYDLRNIDFFQAKAALERLPPLLQAAEAGKLHRIPCCYELGLDLERVAQHTLLTRDEIIALHTGAIYTVYAIGFCPGFPYLGYLPSALCGVPRLENPRLRLEAGSVGLTGRQTGIYTEVRPGGWNIIARTPLQLVDVADGYFPLETGDRVQFERIDEKTFNELRGRRLD